MVFKLRYFEAITKGLSEDEKISGTELREKTGASKETEE